MWGTSLSGPLPIVGQVGRYPACCLMGRMPIRHPRVCRNPFMECGPCGVNLPFGRLSRGGGQVAYALLTRAPVAGGASTPLPLDLHVLGLSLAFILSQDQTLRCMNCSFLSLSGCPSLLCLHLSVLTVACYAFLSLSFSSIANPSKISLFVLSARPPPRRCPSFSKAGAKVGPFRIPSKSFRIFFRKFLRWD